MLPTVNVAFVPSPLVDKTRMEFKLLKLGYPMPLASANPDPVIVAVNVTTEPIAGVPLLTAVAEESASVPSPLKDQVNVLNLVRAALPVML